jgi:hypothetical protein
MVNNQSTTQYEKLIEKPMAKNINYCAIQFHINDSFMKFRFSLNNVDYVFEIFFKIKDHKYHCDCLEFGDKCFKKRLNLKMYPILKMKLLCDKDYVFEVYFDDELILTADVNFSEIF